MSSGWLEQKERSYTWVMKLMVWIAFTFGRPMSRCFLYPIALYYLIFSKRAKEASKNFLGRVLSKKITYLNIFRHYFFFSSVFLDRVFILKNGGKDLALKVYGESVLSELKDQGCLLFGSHLGSFEIARAFGLSKQGFELKVLMHESQSKNANTLLNSLNPEFAKTIIQIGGPHSLLQVKELVNQGHMVALLADRAFHKEKTTPCAFLGGKACLPSGPIVLASILKVPVILFFGIYKGGNRYEIHFEKFTDLVQLDALDKDRSIQEWTQQYADRLSYYCKIAPFNWFNFYNYWQ
jgi:predicted LPLAT superfamily acyltransferase